MTTINKTSNLPNLPYSLQQMSELVLAVEQYPKFLSWCQHAHITRKESNLIQTTIQGQKYGFNFTFPLVYHLRHSADKTLISIQLPYKGPFKEIEGLWMINISDTAPKPISSRPIADPVVKESCVLNLEFKFELSGFLGFTLTPLLKKEINALFDAFITRAKELYGRNNTQ